MTPIIGTGTAGFIGSAFARRWLTDQRGPLISVDALTYAGNPSNYEGLIDDPNHTFVEGNINDTELFTQLLTTHHPQAIVNFAAESHVDRSILGPEEFIDTNIVGTYRLLEAARAYWNELEEPEKSAFRFIHVSTDEVYGSLELDDPAFTEETPYRPSSPYSASKAASDHMVLAWHHTYGFPSIVSNCSNNYGPYHFPEKLIPLVILSAIDGKSLPIYGDGLNVRDWLYVDDHVSAIIQILDESDVGETWCIGGNAERTNKDVVETICAMLDAQHPRDDKKSYKEQITFVKDRPGHDKRYAMNNTKLKNKLGWEPSLTFEDGIQKTVDWYLENLDWVEQVKTGAYREWVGRQYGM